MNNRQLKRLAKVNGWIKHRNGGSHEIWRRGTAEQITIPYRCRPFVAKNIAKQLTVSKVAQNPLIFARFCAILTA